ncbi:PTS sugar transporter subunit IIA [Sporolactobacillus putidus]|uniref:PTS sugar transporter subunit IIA n=1 Tax=Sporolactobacillus putidus TaxID=492735 RepID=A0A917S5G4_9BACL|nr:PTS sugar transporter subunit IIA [Sporolactobacillus putidus]GGL57111.1 PTS sugar transporter subunit IIA [Sporolactobacillus putidus]
MYFDREIILFNQSATDRGNALKLLADEFLKRKLVTNKFLDGILERERNYPTGLNVNGLGIAIPHTDSDKVIVSQLGFLSLAKPVEFREMGSNVGKVDVSMIFMLCLKNANDQLEMLQKLVALFQNEHLVSQLQTCDSVENFIEVMKQAGIK